MCPRSIFGWDLPPGVTNRMIEAQFEEGPCEVCFRHVDDCICPECPKCGDFGNPQCYIEHGLKYSIDQKIGKVKNSISILSEQLNDAHMELAELEMEKKGIKK